ncbi:MAG: hypothetical protein LBT50_08755, partial [Prevotellaceae bacterium]|nr:hypothetical protein [Prevotellaceae bacterium]
MRRVFLVVIFSFVCNITISQIDYSKRWENIDSITQKHLYESAINEVMAVYDYALKHKDYGQVIKAIIYRMSNQAALQEDAAQEILDSLKQDVVRLPQPAKSVVYNIIGNVYKEYYTKNYHVADRTRAAIVDNDFKTWDASRLSEESIKYYSLSIQDEEILKQTPLKDYNEIVDYTQSLRQQIVFPTLYDFLVFNAIAAYDHASSFTFPQKTMSLDKPEYFADVNTFVNYTVENPDTLSAEYNAISLYQKLLRFRLQENNDVLALIGIDIERLRYIHAKGIYQNNDDLYATALKSLMTAYSHAEEEWSYPAYALAVLCQRQGNDWRTLKDNKLRDKIKEANDLCAKIVALPTKNETKAIVLLAKDLQRRIKYPAIELTFEQLHYPNTPVLSLVKYKNTDKLYLKIYKLGEEYFVQNNKKEIKFDDFKTVKPVAAKEIVLPSKGDYQSYSAEIMIDDGLSQGLYVVFAGNSPNLSMEAQGDVVISSIFQVSSLMAALRSDNNELVSKYDHKISSINNKSQVYVADGKTGEPAKDATIDYFTSDDNLTTYYSDEKGLINIAGEKQAHFSKAIVRKDTARLIIYEWYPKQVYMSESEIITYAVFFTDRSIYRPGQTVYYKALFMAANSYSAKNLIVDKEFEISFVDANGKKISSQTFTTNDYGTVHGSFDIPQGLLNGTMTLSAENYGSQNIRVEEYKRPSFEVKFAPVTGSYRFNDSIRVTGVAKSFAGYAIDGAKVQYRINRSAIPFFYDNSSNFNDPSHEIASGTVNTDNEGAFVIDFKAKTDNIRNENFVYGYNVVVDITDINGETHSAVTWVNVGKKPLVIKADIPREIINRDSLNFNIQTTNLNANFTPADLTVSITALKSPDKILRARLWKTPDTLAMSRTEFQKYFPIDPYGDEDDWKKYEEDRKIISYQMKTTDDKAVVAASNEATHNKISLAALRNAKAGWYRIDIKAKNAENVEVCQEIFVYLKSNPPVKSLSAKSPEPSSIQTMYNWFTVIKDSGEPGENAELWVGGGEEKSYIFYNLIHKGRIIEQKIIVAGKTPERIIIPLKEEYKSGVSASFLMLQNGRMYSQSHIITVPYTNKQMDIAFTTFRNKLLPGEKEKWILEIKNNKGEKEQAEMVATLFDASLETFGGHWWQERFYGSDYIDVDWNNSFYPTTQSSRYHRGYNASSLWDDSSYGLKSEIFAYPYLNMFRYGDEHILHYDYYFSESRSFSESIVVAYGTNKEDFKRKKMTDNSTVQLADITPRKNFNETAFFYPQLRTNENGEIIIEFTIPEALTRWKMLGFAHTKDFKTGNITNELITQKQIAISANAPRFFRENDTIEFTAKVNNIT